MENKKNFSYQIGLDMGVASIGWAVVNDQNKLVRKRGKNLWGVRLFEEAKTAEERRAFRRQRRTINKRNWRLSLLKNELKEFVSKEDPKFFERLQNSQIKPDKYLLFDGKYNDASYMREFPTIFHLRKALMDVEKCKLYQERKIYYRLLFLAINDILKTRGNFLTTGSLSGDGANTLTSIKKKIITLGQKFAEHNEDLVLDNDFIIESLEKHIHDVEKINSRKNDTSTTYLKAILGYKFDINKILNVDDEKLIYSFDDEEWELNLSNNDFIDGILFDLFDIYTRIRLYLLLGDHSTLSEAKIVIFNNHKHDLNMLKKDIKKIDSTLNTSYFQTLFSTKDSKIVSYTNYVGKLLEKGKKIRVEKKTSREDLIKRLLKMREEYLEVTSDISVLDYLTREDFLVVPTNKDNRLIPYQLHYNELEIILANFVSLEKSQDVSPRSDRIKQLLKFKVPYYVGPLSNKHNKENKNYWLIKNLGHEQTKITPYNFDTVVNKKMTNEAFIKNMLRTCTYLTKENCIQQETILYQTFIFYNTINKIKINDRNLTKEEKAHLYEVLKNNKTLSKSRIIKVLKVPSDSDISGFSNSDEEKPLQIALTAIKRFESIFPEHKDNPFYQVFYDEIINKNSLLDSTEVSLRKEQVMSILATYKTISLTDNQIEQLISLKSKRWGNLSEKFLNELLLVDNNGELKTVLDILKDSNLNLMEIIYLNKNQEIIEKQNEERYDLATSNGLHNYLKEKYISPMARRTIIQANLLVDEIIKIMGGILPAQISIEFTRERQAIRRETSSRMEQIKNLYKNIDSEYKTAHHEFEKVLNTKNNDILQARKVYLYFLQLGKDIYTGKPIDFDLLISNSKTYDIDHIYPQSRIKDDSLDNLVLTSSVINGELGNITPLPKEIQEKNIAFWQYLLNKNLMSSKKYERLTRTFPLTDEEITDFVNRQKTTLDWINTEIANVLNIKYNTKDSKDFIIYSKSRHISNFRNDFKLLKFRELNDFHHAHDAYLNIVIGKTIQKSLYVTFDGKFRTYNYDRIIRNKLGDDIQYIRDIFNYHDIFVTKKTKIDSSGKFWDQQMVSPKPSGKNESYAPIKKHLDVNIYGGYNKVNTAFFTILKKGSNTVVEAIPTVDCQSFYEDNIFNYKQFVEYINVKFPKYEILEAIVPIGQKVIIDGVPLRIAGKSGSGILYHNTGQIKLDEKTQLYLRKIFLIQKRYRGTKITNEMWESREFTREKNIFCYRKIVNKLEELTYNHKLFLEFPLEKLIKNGTAEIEFQQMELNEQLSVLSTIFTNLISPNTSNQGKIFGVTYSDKRISKNINQKYSLVKESVTGFYSKKVAIYV